MFFPACLPKKVLLTPVVLYSPAPTPKVVLPVVKVAKPAIMPFRLKTKSKSVVVPKKLVAVALEFPVKFHVVVYAFIIVNAQIVIVKNKIFFIL